MKYHENTVFHIYKIQKLNERINKLINTYGPTSHPQNKRERDGKKGHNKKDLP